jgi:endonuclease/exonuclease/phosphatase family metal-dependent hydrolase
MHMKIMTFNTQHCLNYITREIDFEVMAKAIREVDADIVGLNEMRGKSDDSEFAEQVETLAALTGIPYFYFAPAICKRGPYGNGFLSKIPIVKAENIPIPDPNPRRFETRYETRCILRAELEGGVTVLVSHFGLNADEQENAVETVLKHMSDRRCILMGDFNLRPDDVILNPIRERMLDTAALFDSEKLSIPSDEPRCKIDYIFVSSDIKILSADIPPIVASDHRPHTATVEMNF